MKKLKIIISILVISIIILLICLLNIRRQEEKDKDNNISEIIEQNIPHSSESDDVYEEEILLEDTFFTVSSCVSQYMDLINENNSIYYGYDNNNKYTKVVNPSEVILNVLSETYKKQNNITKNNIKNNINLLSEKVLFVPIKMKVISNEYINKYLVYGIVESLDNKYIRDEYVFVNIDSENATFSIEPYNNQKNSDFDNIQYSNNETSIKNNDWNQYKEVSADKEYLSKMFLDKYKKICLAKPDIAYEYLNKEYREKRFGSLENYKNYIIENREGISSIQCEKYLVNGYDDYSEYVIQDKYQNLYIFNVKNITDFDIKLDTYSIPTENFKTTYSNAKEEQKVQMNIDKFIQMINRHDYITSYNCLAEGFKNNYFKTEESFKKYVKSRFFEYNKVQFVECSNQGNNTYVYKIKLTDLTEKSKKEKNLNIIMQLKEGFNFVMSFSIT